MSAERRAERRQRYSARQHKRRRCRVCGQPYVVGEMAAHRLASTRHAEMVSRPPATRWQVIGEPPPPDDE